MSAGKAPPAPNAVLRSPLMRSATLIGDCLAGGESSILPMAHHNNRQLRTIAWGRGVASAARAAELPRRLDVVSTRDRTTEAVMRILTVLSVLLMLAGCG